MFQTEYASPRGQYFPIAADPVADFTDALAGVGLMPGKSGIVADDAWNRCDTGDKPGDRDDGRYILTVNPDGFAFGYAVNSKTGETISFNNGRSLGRAVTEQEREAQRQQRERAARGRQADQAERRSRAMAQFDAAQPCQSHPYFTEKGVPVPSDCRVDANGTAMVPVYHNGKTVGYERIVCEKPADGPRKKHNWGGLGDGYHWTDGETDRVYVTEGIAKSMAVHHVTGSVVFTAFGKGRLTGCAERARELHPDAAIIVAGDTDAADAAQKAAWAVDGEAVTPQGAGVDWDDILRLQGDAALLDALSLDGETKELEIELDPYGYSDDALAVELGRREWDEDAKFVPQWGKWLFWDGSRWVRDERLSSHSRIRRYMTDRASDYEMWGLKNGITEKEIGAKKHQMRSAGKISAVESLARSNPKSAALHDDFDCDLMLMGSPKGTVDLRTGKLRPSRREDMLTKTVAVSPAPEGSVPVRWLEFLEQVFDGDQETIAFMKRIAGYSLTGMTTEHRLFFLSGTGANGKSVFLNTLTGMMGDYAQRSSAETFLLSYGDKHSTSTAALQGARMVVGSELPKGRQWNDAIIKDLTGGDRMRARFMRQDEFEFTPQLTLLIAGNTKPSFGAVDEAMRRRVVLIPFDVTIPAHQRDPDLPAKLEKEWPAILRWAIEGAIEWQRMGLAIPSVIDAASSDYMDGEDEIGQFLDDRTIADVSGWVSRGDLIHAYKSWCFNEQVDEMSRGNFYKAIEERRYRKAKRTGTDGFSGLRIA